MPKHSDPFRECRQQTGVTTAHAEGQEVPLLLRLKDIRNTCKDTETFSNDNPLMIVLHSEAHVRKVRQLPIETDPPDHTEYRALVEPIYRRPRQAEYQAAMRALVGDMIQAASEEAEIEAVRGFAVPLQSRGLAMLLGLPQEEADLWIEWGVHIFRDAELGPKDSEVDEYILMKFEETANSQGDDFFSVLNRIDFRGRKLTLEEKHGFANMAFAGGRDTIINTVSSILVYLAEHVEAIDFLRENNSKIMNAAEEFVRYFSPLTIISRTCPHATNVHGHQVNEGERIGLCWPSANRDESVFENADEVVLDRAPNPHVGFGFGVHNCLGQHQARSIIRSLLEVVCERVERFELIDATPEIETESSYSRQVGYKSVRMRIVARRFQTSS
ncbi:MAG: cytochrome P450 [Planctomycetota bacterium]